MFLTTVWFALNLLATIFDVYDYRFTLITYHVMLAWAFLFPSKLMRTTYEEHSAELSANRSWKWALYWADALCWSLAVGMFVASWVLQVLSLQQVSLVLFVVFSAALVYNLLVLSTSRKRVDSEERSYQKWSKILYVLIILVFAQSVVAIAGWIDARRYFEFISVLSRACPIMFLFIGTYFKGRFTFYDVLMKRGLLFLVAQASLTVCIAIFGSHIQGSGSRWIHAWMLAYVLLPLVLLVPFLYSRLEGWLDRTWLGRSFSPVEAGTFFFEGIIRATSEDEIVHLAETQLAEIYQAPAEICLDSHPREPVFAVQYEAPIKTTRGLFGILRMGPRANRAPYFSEDQKLLTYLASGFGLLLDYVHLQLKRQQQEKREQELMLHASQSKLKALRAQINPHFLFNALNSIAGLIPRDPLLAEQTVEQLAEVFRYTLKRSETEWVRLGDEMEFIHAYLDVERARFGTRLQVESDIATETLDARVPSMMVQTLVENAIKHGVSRIRGTGKVQIRARALQQNRLRIEVADNGEGFSTDREPSLAEDRRSAGFGLKSLEERLRGYFGEEARLQIQRDQGEALTRVVLELPFVKTPVTEGLLAK